jgi:hypothetical protein
MDGKGESANREHSKAGRIERIRRDLRMVLEARPGERFLNHYRRSNGNGPKPILHRILYVGLGMLLILSGGLLGFAPLLPGIVLAVIGTAMIVSQLRSAALFLDRTELRLRRFCARIRRRDQ